MFLHESHSLGVSGGGNVIKCCERLPIGIQSNIRSGGSLQEAFDGASELGLRRAGTREQDVQAKA